MVRAQQLGASVDQQFASNRVSPIGGQQDGANSRGNRAVASRWLAAQARDGIELQAWRIPSVVRFRAFVATVIANAMARRPIQWPEPSSEMQTPNRQRAQRFLLHRGHRRWSQFLRWQSLQTPRRSRFQGNHASPATSIFSRVSRDQLFENAGSSRGLGPSRARRANTDGADLTGRDLAVMHAWRMQYAKLPALLLAEANELLPRSRPLRVT